jgi:hypothetical protein
MGLNPNQASFLLLAVDDDDDDDDVVVVVVFFHVNIRFRVSHHYCVNF